MPSPSTFDRVGQEVELDPLVHRGLHLFGVGRHGLALAPVDHMHFFGAQAPGGAGRVQGHVAAADHGHALAVTTASVLGTRR